MLSELDLRVRFAVYTTLAEGGVPLSAMLAARLHIPQPEVHDSFERLHAAHVIVLDSRTREVSMALPFSAAPTNFRVSAHDRTWFANCAWDAFGIVALTRRDAVLTTACPDCEAPIVHRVEERQLVDAHGVVHFAVPAAKWWDDIGFT